VISLSAILVVLAWIGAVINNLLLMYFIVLGLVLLPGLQKKQMFKQVFSLFESKMQQVRQKVAKTE